VLAGAIKDSGRGRVAGERSFGKGLIQTLVELSDGSALAVTVAKYQTPAGVDINRVGIQPDLELPPAALDALPMNGAGFCRLAAGDAPALF
jgi:C-terminal processing protease CtpA/Prc